MNASNTLKLKMSPIKRFWNRQIKIHRYFKISGGYRFMGKNLLRLLLFLALFAVAAWALNEFVIDFEEISNQITQKYSPAMVVAWLFLSEIIVGVLPPEAFILWAKSFSQPYLWVFILATVSYAGGLVSFWIGTRLYKFRRIHNWVDTKFKDQILQIKKYGGLLIAIAALTPLPYPLISMVSGLAGVKFQLFARVALIRYLRFFIYAYIFYRTL